MLRGRLPGERGLTLDEPLVATPPERFGSVLLSDEEYHVLAKRSRKDVA